MTSVERVSTLVEVERELQQQDQKWGEQNHPVSKWLAILMEEVGEVAKADLERNIEDVKKELIQVAAVAIQAVECFKRDGEIYF